MIGLRYENPSTDIIKCNCGSTICIVFHPSLNEESRDRLTQKYLDLLVSSHISGCPFRSFASRWSKALHQCSCRGADCDKSNNQAEAIVTKENNSQYLMNKVSEVLNDTKTDFYVPPYFLSLSDEFLRFEDCTSDGSITREWVKEDALKIHGKLQAMGDFQVDVTIPDAVTKFCSEVLPDADVGNTLYHKDSSMKVPYLLSIFGWSICNDESVAGENDVIVKCSMCQARTLLASSTPTGEEASRKRRRVDTRDDAHLKLIDSHRIYCPYVSGFSSADLPGWKVVVSNLLKSATNTPTLI